MSRSFSKRTLHFFSSDSIFFHRFCAQSCLLVLTHQHGSQLVIVEGLSKFITVGMVFVWTSFFRHGNKVKPIMIPLRFMGIHCHSFELVNLLIGAAKRVFMVLILLNFRYTSLVVIDFKNSVFALWVQASLSVWCADDRWQNPCLPLSC